MKNVGKKIPIIHNLGWKANCQSCPRGHNATARLKLKRPCDSEHNKDFYKGKIHTETANYAIFKFFCN